MTRARARLGHRLHPLVFQRPHPLTVTAVRDYRGLRPRSAWGSRPPALVLICYNGVEPAGSALMLKVGDIAPEIDAVTTDGSRFVLSDAPGLCTIVYFYPRAFTPGCTAEAEHFRDNRAELLMAGAHIVGISADDVKTQCRFADEVGTRFPLIADPDGALTRAYGVKWSILGLARRVTFVIGSGRRVEAVFEHRSFVPFKPGDPLAFVDEVLAFVHRLQAESLRDSERS